MKREINRLISRYPQSIDDTVSEPSMIKQQELGGDSKINVPFGGFPPLIICARDSASIDQKPRHYSSHHKKVSLNDIIKNRRDMPFIRTR